MLIVVSLLGSCSENDDLPPVMTLKGEDTIYHVLNREYNDPGVSALDETDGDVTIKVFIDNQVNIDRMGEYSVTYRVVDEAGNEASPLSRVVYVYNEGIMYYGDYDASDLEIFPGQSVCTYPSYIWVDSTVNNRLVFLDFACSSKRQVYADVNDTIIVMPFQLIQDTVVNMSLQGAGLINDTAVFLEYTRKEPGSTSYWQVTFNRVK
jgi:hypothetical protein